MSVEQNAPDVRDVRSPDASAAEFAAKVRVQANRYLTAVYGPDAAYRGPETFPNLVERWIAMLAAGYVEGADRVMAEIERQAADAEGGPR